MQDMIGSELDRFNSMMTKLRDSVEDEPEKQVMTTVLDGCQQFQTVLNNNKLFDYKELTKDLFKDNEDKPEEQPSVEQPSDESSNVSPDSPPIYSISRYIRL